MEEIGKIIKELRKLNNLTQEELSIKSGLGLRFIREVENGKKTARIDKVLEILDFFGYELVAQRKR